MPQLAGSSSAASSSSTTTSVFARFKRQQSNGGSSHANKSVTNLSVDADDGPVEWRGGKLIQHERAPRTAHHHPHRRDSSILSLTTSVTDSAKGFGANVRRSVSLRSHRTNGSTSGSSLGNSTARSPSIITTHQSFTPLTPDTTIEQPEGEDKALSPPSHAPPAPPIVKRKISLTARGLSHKFKSTENLHRLHSASTAAPFSPPKSDPRASMLVSTQPAHAPLGRKNSDQNRPGLQPQASFTRDISSSHSNGAPLQPVPSLPQGMAAAGPLNPSTIYTQIHETSAKRIATIDYMRKLHEGDIFYFGTIHYSQSALHGMPSMHAYKLGRRATNYFLLGHSLPALLDLNSNTPLEYLRALSALLTEFETYQSLCGWDASGNVVKNSRMGGMFKSGIRGSKGRRSSTAIAPLDLSLETKPDLLGIAHKDANPHSPSDMSSTINPTGHEFQFLLTPHIPFEPDFSTTLGTLCDTLMDVYGKLMDLVSGPEHCNPTLIDAFSKADKAIRKIMVANVAREFEDTTRASVKSEIAGLGKLTLGGLM
ncbi:hypothetical protein CKM354_000741700 [Cercospora kikuchii]|uniref:Uncharacterized protein n=1 Tax=Cercospora kikuchii TaxID=84275 RepID=A0A9P3CK35_9PEZI|nr:uncharacterized protein CKM354_000741700 [Cercospora kikuchii]GIZ44213.1 hypothetical protein CKM354_000741700 [Cercospora kikuchii]